MPSPPIRIAPNPHIASIARTHSYFDPLPPGERRWLQPCLIHIGLVASFSRLFPSRPRPFRYVSLLFGVYSTCMVGHLLHGRPLRYLAALSPDGYGRRPGMIEARPLRPERSGRLRGSRDRPKSGASASSSTTSWCSCSSAGSGGA